jgi:hypothetical protein
MQLPFLNRRRRWLRVRSAGRTLRLFGPMESTWERMRLGRWNEQSVTDDFANVLLDFDTTVRRSYVKALAAQQGRE